ncbi:MAG TPA: hypothetical protein VM285_01220 [Polyangia bacterium]|nr:hypothetical protein [Polyangia bacterium]
MATKKKGDSGKRTAKRVEAEAQGGRSATPKETRDEPEAPRIAARIQEKDSGLGVLKALGIGVIVLILGAGVLSRMVGGETESRGDKLPGEKCDSTQECARGSICYTYKGEAHRCFTVCSADEPCDPGYRCVSAAEQTGRRKTKVRSVCVGDDSGS